jgi:hypothetical protein
MKPGVWGQSPQQAGGQVLESGRVPASAMAKAQAVSLFFKRHQRSGLCIHIDINKSLICQNG